MINFAKGVRSFLVVALVVLAFSLMAIVSVPVCNTNIDDLMQNYNAFNLSLSSMIDQYGGLEEQTISIASTEHSNNNFNRLIVTTDKEDLNDFGAVAKAEFNKYHIFQYSSSDEAQRAYDFYSKMSDVEVGFDSVVSIDDEVEEIEVDSSYTYNSWGASYVGYQTYVSSLLANNEQESLQEVVVAVLDSGINTSHVLFEGRILHQYAKNWINETVSTNYAYEDMNGHGTHVSGVIAEATLSNVKILPLKVLNSEGRGLVTSIIDAIEYATTLAKTSLPGLKVMNMSIGVDDSKSTQGNGLSVGAKSTSLSNAVIDAYNDGVISVVSAGNENRNTSYAVPANVDCAITVSAVKQEYNAYTGKNLVFHGQYTDAYGISHYGYSNYGKHVDFCAPGTSIKSAYIGGSKATAYLSGTSMAAPHVTAAVALLYSNPDYKDYNFDELNTLLRQNADKSQLHTTGNFAVSSSERDDYYGYGLISVKGIGVLSAGYVAFSNNNEFNEHAFSLTLDYDGEYDKASGEYVSIYYSTDENVISLDLTSSQGMLYKSPIIVSKTTKVTAVAYVYNASNDLIKKSHSTSFVYYFDNVDIAPNFVFEETDSGLVLTKYTGKLSTLNVQQKINGVEIVEIDERAFNDSMVEVLYLPAVDNFKINSKAFYSNSTINEIYSTSPSLSVGSEAFRYCGNLEKVEIENAISLGNFAFANNSKISSLNLPYVENIGQHAISGTKLNSILIGKNILSMESQTNLVLTKIYGYADTVAEEFAFENEIEFCDLTLKIQEDFSSRVIIKESEELSLKLNFVGYMPYYSIGTDFASSSYSSIMESGKDYAHSITIKFDNLAVGENDFLITLSDKYGTQLKSVKTRIIIVADNTQTYDLNYVEGCFDVYVDGVLADSELVLYKGFDYEIKIIAKPGYEIDQLVLNEKNVTTPIFVENIDQQLNLSVLTSEKEVLSVEFYMNEGGRVLIDDSVISVATVNRSGDLSFVVEPEVGYKIASIKANGVYLTSDSNVYVIENVVHDLLVEIDFDMIKYNVSITTGKGGSVFRKGVLTDSTTVKHGSDLEFDIVCSDGYEVDFVTINGEKISLENNSFVVKAIDKDCDIIVSFKVAKNSIFAGDDNVIMRYFIIFAALFVVFVAAKILLSIFRKNQKNN